MRKIRPIELTVLKKSRLYKKNYDYLHILYFSGAYPYDSWKKWVSLSSIISAETVSRLEPISGQIHSVTELLPNSVGDHIDEQETSIRCQNSEEREANLVCNQITGCPITKLCFLKVHIALTSLARI